LELQIINPLDYPGWDELLLKTPNSSFFHSSHWTRVLNESYGYKPLYFSEINGNRLITLISMMEVKSVLTGKRGVSLPFTDYCELIISDKDNFQALMDHLIEYGKKAGWKSIEMRSCNTLPQDIPLSSFYYGHTLGLTQGEETIFSNFRDSTKRNIRKAIKEGLNVTINTSLKSIEEFYRLNCLTRKEHGLPPQPYYFFKKIYEHIISKNIGIVVLAEYKNKNIAGAVYFHFGDKAIYKYGASDKNHLYLRANNLVMWEAIKWCSQSGFKEFCFGRTEPENQGLLQFKRGWGTKEDIIKYYKYELRKEEFVKDSSKVTALHNKIFNRMPMPLLRIIGMVLYKHMG
jgi:hypothetical protein